jgi:hypothetical protein
MEDMGLPVHYATGALSVDESLRPQLARRFHGLKTRGPVVTAIPESMQSKEETDHG